MSHHDQHQIPVVAYPPTAYAPPRPVEGEGKGYPYHQGPYVVPPPPPIGYPTKDGSGYPQGGPPPADTKSRGDGFWKGCFAALCCCCVLDMCF